MRACSFACVRVVTANSSAAEAIRRSKMYEAPVPATSATAATSHASAKSAAPTIRQDFRFDKIPEIQAVAETTVAANETATNDWFSTAAGMSNPCTDHSADESHKPLR